MKGTLGRIDLRRFGKGLRRCVRVYGKGSVFLEGVN